MIRPRQAVVSLMAAVVVVAAVSLLMGRSVPLREPAHAADEGAGVRDTAEPAPSALASRIDGRRVLGTAEADGGSRTSDGLLDHPGTHREVVSRDAETAASLQELKGVIASSSDLRSQLAALNELASREGEAVDALAEIANDLALPVRVRREAALLLANRPGEVAYETLLGLLEAGETDLRLAAVQGLGMLGDADALNRLSEAFYTETSPAVARAIVQAIGRIGTPEAVDTLLGYFYLEDPLRSIHRNAVLGTLAGISNQGAVPALTNALNATNDPECRRALVAALARIADPSSFGILLQTLQEADLQTRCEAMQGLGLIGDPRALAALRALEWVGSQKERSYAQTAIQRIESCGR